MRGIRRKGRRVVGRMADTEEEATEEGRAKGITMVDVGQYETEAGRRTPKETQRQAEAAAERQGRG